MGQGTSLLALAVVKKALHECKLQRCSVELPFDEIKEHEEKCNWRLVLCPSPGSICRAMVPFCTMIDHVGVCTGFVNKYPKALLGDTFYRTFVRTTAEDGGGDRSWRTEVYQREGKLFFCRFVKRDGKYTLDVVMGGTKEDCKKYVVEASVMNTVYKASFPPRPLGKQNEAKFCLSFNQEDISEEWRYNKQNNGYCIVYMIQIKKL